MRNKVLALVVMCSCLTACAERPLPESQNIQVIHDPDLAKHCTHFANTLIKSGNPILRREKQSEVMLIRAKNLAYELGADTVVPMPATFKDRQPFQFYICTPKDNDNS